MVSTNSSSCSRGEQLWTPGGSLKPTHAHTHTHTNYLDESGTCTSFKSHHSLSHTHANIPTETLSLSPAASFRIIAAEQNRTPQLDKAACSRRGKYSRFGSILGAKGPSTEPTRGGGGRGQLGGRRGWRDALGTARAQLQR